MKSAVILFPGTNRERDMAAALLRATGTAPRIVWHGETNLPDVDLIVLPGGFSFGDYLRSGAIAARSPAMSEVVKRAGQGVLVLVDMFGGTPSNLSLSFLEEGRVEVVTGVNLPMLVKVARPKGGADIHELAEVARDYGRRNISVASDLLSSREPGKGGS